MTANQFNLKYKDYLKDGHYGLDINNNKIISYLDRQFQEFIHLPNFKYMQIKEKFNQGRFYCEGLNKEIIEKVEQFITDNI